jgi:tRNA uridine 5-carbamoylmethylation protein Kti12
MALITISGFPSSGKSTRARQIKQALEDKLSEPAYDGPALTVHVLDDDSLNLERSVYNGRPNHTASICRSIIGVVKILDPRSLLVAPSSRPCSV